MTLAPIALFVYNRPDHTRRTVETLQKNLLANESDLFIFSDNAKTDKEQEKVNRVQQYLKTITGFKTVTIVEHRENWGLAKSIIAGVTEIVNKFGRIIVLEDDLVTAPYFLTFMNEALEFYQTEEKVISVHGYIYPVMMELPETFFVQHTASWGWATWARGWQMFEPNGQKLLDQLTEKNLLAKFNFNGAYNFVGMLKRQIAGITDSWAIRWSASSLVNNKLNLYPHQSLVQNIGQDGSGTHGGQSSQYQVMLSQSKIAVAQIPIAVSPLATAAFTSFFRSLHPSLITRIKWKLNRL